MNFFFWRHFHERGVTVWSNHLHTSGSCDLLVTVDEKSQDNQSLQGSSFKEHGFMHEMS